MSGLFINRPIFAWVISIVIMLAGLGGILTLPVEQFPDIAPPTVNIRANYPGASAQTLETSVTQVIEQQLTGVDGLLYFTSNSSSRGTVSITATFDKGVNADVAQVQVQNRVQQSLPRLPAQVQQQGLVVTKSNPDFLIIIAIYDTTDRTTNIDVSDFMVSTLQDPIARLQGVGDVSVFGSQYAMRVWLNPTRLRAFGLIPSDIVSAIQAQNAEVAAGEIGALPSPSNQMLNATVTAQSRLSTPEQFRAIILKTEPNGSIVRLSDVARVELGAESYQILSRVNGHPGAGIAISLAPGADALSTAERVKQYVRDHEKDLPQGYAFAFPNDSTNFIRLSIEEVVKTLIEAIILVVIVMFVFLQSWRATLIPAIAVPVVLLGTFGVLAVAGFSINTLTLFALVLAIGLLVDDAIVVVENVERLLAENPDMTPKEATIQSMGEIQIALIAIALVLSAVFLPMAFFGGSTGVIYRQFSVTIVSAMMLSVLVALILTPALTAIMLKQKPRASNESAAPPSTKILARARDQFNRGFATMIERYLAIVTQMIARTGAALLAFGAICLVLAFLFLRLPTSFLPTEDQGFALVQFQLPAGATQQRTFEIQKAVERYFQKGPDAKNIEAMFTVTGGGGAGGSGQNTGIGYLALKDWSQRPGAANGADSIAQRAMMNLSALRDARIFALVPPAIRGLGQSNGFTMELLNSGGLTYEAFNAAQEQLIKAAAQNSALVAVRQGGLPDVPTVKVDADPEALNALSLNQTDVNSTLSIAWGGRYVNDFNDRGRVKRVYVQGDADYRSNPSDLGQWFVRSSSGAMAPFSSFARTSWSQAPTTLSRFTGVPSYEIQGQPAPGRSSGEAMDQIEALAKQIPGVSVAWSGLSYQERLSSGQAPLLYGVSLLVVFLCLAALHESWSIPIAVLLVVPLGLVGAVLAVTLRGLQNDVFFQIGILTTMGLAAKNAILMIEFAEQAERKGMSAMESALAAARIRLRPILMTSLAFMFGVAPLAFSSGAGANGRIAIGTAVIGGMVTATVLAVFYIPLFFVLVRQGLRRVRMPWSPRPRPAT